MPKGGKGRLGISHAYPVDHTHERRGRTFCRKARTLCKPCGRRPMGRGTGCADLRGHAARRGTSAVSALGLVRGGQFQALGRGAQPARQRRRLFRERSCGGAAVRRCGGVLEHPAFSKAWEAHGLLPPPPLGWGHTGDSEWVCEVWQSAYGHRATKRTWLFYTGRPPADLDWSRPVGSHQCGFHDQRGKERNKPTLGKKEASATPSAFRDALLKLARSCASTG